ncbi:AroB: 3-dehydroquinate synthase [Desulfosarcina variabilis str. Montpellier]|uniref:3-dehydroquinate synthase n=1 Tax=Desulfosarcina variabilis TaxID=2300 RepID=UPI003AFA4993
MKTIEQRFSIQYRFSVFFDRKVFKEENPLLASTLMQGGPKRHHVLCVVDSGLLDAHPSLCEQIDAYAAKHQDVMQLCTPILVAQGGERCKNEPTIIETLLKSVREHHLCRHSYILAIGGGAVLDAVGYGAAIAHRGLRLIRMPTTVLAQNDAGIGVKNSINLLGRKNFIGTFAPPVAVINDFSFLETLSPRQRRAGMAEAVKVALIKDPSFFNALYDQRSDLARFRPQSMEEMIYRCAALHMQHTGNGGDPFELGSARPLDFGHWSAHKLEEITRGRLNHGEAVSIGMALDSLYANRCNMIEDGELQQILALLGDLELPCYDPALSEMDVAAALGEFREHLGGELAITLLTGIGSKKEVDHIDAALMERCIEALRDYDDGRVQRVDHTGDAAALAGELN